MKEVVIKPVLHLNLLKLYVYDPISKKSKRYSLDIQATEETLPIAAAQASGEIKRAQDVCDMLRLNGASFDFGRFENQFMKKTKVVTIKSYADEFYKTVNKESTITAYSDSVKAVTRHLGESVTFGAITPNWIRKFWKDCKDAKLSDNTIQFYLRHLRALYNRAAEDGLAYQEYPFKKIKLSSSSSFKRYLNKEEIEALIKCKYKDKSGKSKWKESRDLWLYSYFAKGLNLKDMFSLKYSQIRDNCFWIKRGKTGNWLKIIINEQMKEIMDRYRTDSDIVFHYFIGNSESKKAELEKHRGILGWIGDNIKNIAKQAKIKNHKEIVFYSARHSFAVHFIKYEGKTTFQLMEHLGHSSEKSTRNYLATMRDIENTIPIDFYNNIKME